MLTRVRQRRPQGFAAGVWRELAAAARHCSDRRSLARLCSDIVLFRVLFVLPSLATTSRTRTIRLDGASITYRLNRGDIQGIREVWFEEAYRVPFGPGPRTVLDLGANIGLTSLWLAHRYRCECVLAVEPDPSNVMIARRNLADNNVSGVIVEAAAGPSDGIAAFARSRASNLGALVPRPEAEATVDVRVLTPGSILSNAGLDSVDLCKLDIEGAEGALLLTGDTAWLDGVGSMLAELHADRIDVAAVIAAIETRGLRRHPAGVDGRKTEFFVR
ncbi:MAG: FkbM family methyltransferase [Solirubrobacteraceae bacterium]